RIFWCVGILTQCDFITARFILAVLTAILRHIFLLYIRELFAVGLVVFYLGGFRTIGHSGQRAGILLGIKCIASLLLLVSGLLRRQQVTRHDVTEDHHHHEPEG